MAEAKLESLVSRLEKAVSQLEKTGVSQPQVQKAAGSLLPSLSDFNELLKEFEQQGNKLDLIELHEMVFYKKLTIKNLFIKFIRKRPLFVVKPSVP